MERIYDVFNEIILGTRDTRFNGLYFNYRQTNLEKHISQKKLMLGYKATTFIKHEGGESILDDRLELPLFSKRFINSLLTIESKFDIYTELFDRTMLALPNLMLNSY